MADLSLKELNEEIFSYALQLMKGAEVPNEDLMTFEQTFQEAKDIEKISLLLQHEPILIEQNLTKEESNEAEIENLFQLLNLYYLKVMAEDRNYELFKTLLQTLSSNTNSEHTQKLRLQMLCNTFNKVNEQVDLQYTCFLTILDYAFHTSQLDSIQKFCHHIETLFSNQLNNVQLCSIYKTLFEYFSKNAEKTMTALQFGLKYLASCDATNMDVETVSKILSVYLQDPVTALVHQVDFSSYASAFSTLRKQSAKFNFYEELVTILSNQSLKEYMVYYNQHQQDFKTYEISHDTLLKAMRLITLTSFGAQFTPITYSTLQDALQIEENDVEKWIMQGISNQLIKAKTNQLKKSVLITFAISRNVNAQNWSEVKEKLTKYQNHIQSLIETIEEKQEIHA